MRPIRALGAAVLFLTVAGSPALLAQDHGQDKKDDRKQHDDKDKQQVPAREQQQRAEREQQRAAQYSHQLDERVRVAQRQSAQLQEQKRVAQAHAQEQYAAELRQQQERLRTTRNYATDPYVTTPHEYRYVVSGRSRETNQYGADLLRQAVNYGYQQGSRAGDADRQDGRRSSYQNAFGYTDANYGYGGNYVDQADYNYYFRQGFRRGYEDGYSRQSQFGTTTNGASTILGTLLNSILGFQSIR